MEKDLNLTKPKFSEANQPYIPITKARGITTGDDNISCRLGEQAFFY
jgi:hypothetical protein